MMWYHIISSYLSYRPSAYHFRGSEVVDLRAQAAQIPVGALLHVRGKQRHGELVLVDVEHPCLFDLGIVLLSFEFVVAEPALDVAVRYGLDRGDPVLEDVVAEFEVADEVLVLGVDTVDLAEVLPEGRRKV